MKPATFSTIQARLGPAQLFALCLLASSCETTASRVRPRPVTAPAVEHETAEGRLAEVNPLDVVVLPIESRVGRADLPLDALRLSMAQSLIRLRYSPLSFGYVDARLGSGPVEAAYTPGALDEHAVLRVVLTGWDDGLWSSHARIDVTGIVELLDARRPEGSLWGGPIATTVDLDPRRVAPATEEALRQAACDELADSILAQLPPRRPEPRVP